MNSNIFTGIEKRNRLNDENSHLMKMKPAVNIYETADAIIVNAEMPNVEKDSLQVFYSKGILKISGRRTEDIPEGEIILRESRNLLYERFFELQESLDSEKIEANYQSGILRIKINKKEESKPRKVEIN